MYSTVVALRIIPWQQIVRYYRPIISISCILSSSTGNIQYRHGRDTHFLGMGKGFGEILGMGEVSGKGIL